MATEEPSDQKGDTHTVSTYTEPAQIFSRRGIHNVDAHGLDPVLWSVVKVLIRDIHKVQTISKQTSEAYGGRSIMPFFKLYQRCVYKVKITGFVIAVKIKEKYTMYTIDDSTGTVHCKQWNKQRKLSSNNSVHGNEKHKQWKIGDWLKIEGALNYFMENIEIDIEMIEAIQDANEELLHWLECAQILKTVLTKPVKFRIEPPVIKLSNEAQRLLNLLHCNGVKQFVFNQLLTNHENMRQFLMQHVLETEQNDNSKSDHKGNDKLMHRKCLFKLRALILELSRLQKVKLVDIKRDIYTVIM